MRIFVFSWGWCFLGQFPCSIVVRKGNAMKIRGKVNLLVGLLSMVTLGVGGLSIFAMSEYQSRMQAYESAAHRAHMGESLNRLVTAVVMEARGIYASDTSEQAVKFGEGLIANLVKMDNLIGEWKPLVPDAQRSTFENLQMRAGEFKAFRTETVRLSQEVDPEAANAQGNNEGNRANRKAFQAEIDAVVQSDLDELEAVRVDLEYFSQTIFIIVGAVTLFGVAAGAAFGLYLGRRQLSAPITELTDAMNRVADGDFETDIPGVGRVDEIGEMATAVEVFKSNGVEVARMNERESSARARSDDLHARMEAVVEAA